jgi:hypothetical protein
MDEDAFLINSLNTDLLTAHAGASDDDDKPPQRKGCLGVVLVVFVIVYACL